MSFSRNFEHKLKITKFGSSNLLFYDSLRQSLRLLEVVPFSSRYNDNKKRKTKKYFNLMIKLFRSCFTDIAGGYLCFVVSIAGIGVVTAIIGDIASYFGCTLGIKDSVTAVVFVALGTSIPGNKKKKSINSAGRSIPSSSINPFCFVFFFFYYLLSLSIQKHFHRSCRDCDLLYHRLSIHLIKKN